MDAGARADLALQAYGVCTAASSRSISVTMYNYATVCMSCRKHDARPSQVERKSAFGGSRNIKLPYPGQLYPPYQRLLELSQ